MQNMESSETLVATLVTNLSQLPPRIVGPVGIVLAGVYWRRDLVVPLLSLAAISMLLVESLVTIYLNVWPPVMVSQRGGAPVRLNCLGGKGPPSVCDGRRGMGTYIAAIFVCGKAKKTVEGEVV